jgi:hypothetical protein
MKMHAIAAQEAHDPWGRRAAIIIAHENTHEHLLVSVATAQEAADF